MKRGISTLGCPEKTLPEVVKLADIFHVDQIEIRSLSGSCDWAAELLKEENLACMEALSAAGRVSVLGCGFNLSCRENAESPERLVRVAERFGVPYLRVFGGIGFDEEIDDRIAGITLRNMERFSSLSSRVRIALETHDGYASAKRCLALFERIGMELPVVWDAHHTLFTGGESLEESFQLLGDRIVDVHFKDSLPGRDGKLRSVLPGDGEFPFSSLFRLLDNTDLTAVFEYEKMWEPELPPLENALKRIW